MIALYIRFKEINQSSIFAVSGKKRKASEKFGRVEKNNPITHNKLLTCETYRCCGQSLHCVEVSFKFVLTMWSLDYHPTFLVDTVQTIFTNEIYNTGIRAN